MKKIALLLAAMVCFSSVAMAEEEEGFVSLFNGKDLTGWTVNGGYATYGATEGYVNINAVGDRYTIDFSCYDGVEENSFSGRFSGGIRYLEPSDFAVAKSCSVKTKSGDVLVSTAHVRDGKHVGSRRLARIPQPSRQ